MSKKIKVEMRYGHNPFSTRPGGIGMVHGVGEEYPKVPKNLADQAFALLPEDLRQPRISLDGPSRGSAKLGFLGGGLGGNWIQPQGVAAASDNDDADFHALRLAANEIQGCVIKRSLDRWLDEGMGFSRLATGYGAGQLLGQHFGQPVQKFGEITTTLRGQTEDAIKKVARKVAAKNPNMKYGDVIQVAVKAVAEKVMPIVGILDAYATAFTQNATGMFREQLDLVNMVMRAGFYLYQMGTLDGFASGETPPPALNMQSYQVGDLLLSAMAGDGLGTIPGSNGLVGLHLLLMPTDMQDWTPQSLPMLLHESGHQLDADVVVRRGKRIITLLEFKQAAVRNALLTAYRSKKLKLTKPFIMIGGTRVPTIELLVKLFASDCAGELSSDLSSGLQTGGAARIAMENGFPAWVVRNGRVIDAKQLIRTEGGFMLEENEHGDHVLTIEAHGTDWMRQEVLACFFDSINFPKDGEMGRRMARLSVGGKVPEFQTFRDESEETDLVIEIPTADIVAAAPYTMAMITTPLEPLCNLAMTRYAMWTPKRQAKVDMLVGEMLKGKKVYPLDQGDIHPQYLAAAAPTAYSEAVTQGRDPGQARLDINASTYGMGKFYGEQSAASKK